MISKAAALIVSIAVVAPQARGADDLERQAQEAIAAKEFRDALAVYETLAAREPANPDYVVWIARLTGWLEEYQAALDTYDRALALAPASVDALVGKATVLIWEKKFADADHLLHRALAIDPANAEARELTGRIAAPQSFEITTGYGRDEFSFAQAGNMGYLGGAFSTSRSRIAGQYERWNRFGELVDRGGASVTHRISDRVWIRGSWMAAPGAHVIARGDFSAGLSRSWPKGFVSSGDYRRLEFADAHVDVVAPGVEYYLSTCPVWLSATFSESRTRFNATGRTASNHSLLIQYHQQVAAPATIRLGFARGNESFAAVALDQIGTFGANTLVGGVDLRLTRRSSLGASYAYQWRSSGAAQQTAGVGLSLRR